VPDPAVFQRALERVAFLSSRPRGILAVQRVPMVLDRGKPLFVRGILRGEEREKIGARHPRLSLLEGWSRLNKNRRERGRGRRGEASGTVPFPAPREFISSARARHQRGAYFFSHPPRLPTSPPSDAQSEHCPRAITPRTYRRIDLSFVRLLRDRVPMREGEARGSRCVSA